MARKPSERARKRSNKKRDAAATESPGDRLLRAGAESLSDAELVGLLVRGPNGDEIGRRLINSRRGLRELLDATPTTLNQPGIGPAGRTGILAAIEIARRLSFLEIEGRNLLKYAQNVAKYLRQRYFRSDQEILGVLYLDPRHRLLAEEEIFRGCRSHVRVDVKPILKRALLANAYELIVFHTHPGGDPRPSKDDLQFTRRLLMTTSLFKIPLIDHIILGADGSWFSFHFEGLLEELDDDEELL